MTPLSQQIQRRVADFIAREHLLPMSADASSGCLVGLSGGPDSVAVLHLLHQLRYRCVALHCNFHLRGAESDRDEQFCRSLCQQLGIELRVQEFDTFGYMQQQHLSLEMAARQLRYQWWQQVVDETQFDVIALGHHRDDSIETLLINLMRGTGIQGLTGIVAHNASTHVIRPLLCLSRQEILAYLADVGLSYVTDSTNAECDTLRNELRNHILPLMEQALPQCRQGITTTLTHLQATAAFADRYIDALDRRLTITQCRWGITWHELRLADLHEALADSELVADFCFEWRRRHTSSQTQVITTPDLLYTMPSDPDELLAHRPQLVEKVLSGDAEPDINPVDTLTETFDLSTISLPLTLRRWCEGDRMAPLGMHGHTKLISDLMTNAHYTPMQKATTWVINDASGSILWAIGLRMSDSHKIKPETRKKLMLQIIPE